MEARVSKRSSSSKHCAQHCMERGGTPLVAEPHDAMLSHDAHMNRMRFSLCIRHLKQEKQSEQKMLHADFTPP